MNLREELERLDLSVTDGTDYGFCQSIWRQMLDVLDAVDSLGVAIADAGYVWTPEMRSAYERATDTSTPIAGQDGSTAPRENDSHD